MRFLVAVALFGLAFASTPVERAMAAYKREAGEPGPAGKKGDGSHGNGCCPDEDDHEAVKQHIMERRRKAFDKDGAEMMDPCPVIVGAIVDCHLVQHHEELQKAADAEGIEVEHVAIAIREFAIAHECYNCKVHRMFGCCIGGGDGAKCSAKIPQEPDWEKASFEEIGKAFHGGEDSAEMSGEVENMDGAVEAEMSRRGAGNGTHSHEGPTREEIEAMICQAAPCVEATFMADWRCHMRQEFMMVMKHVKMHIAHECGFDMPANATIGGGTRR